jgi:general stress protein 26
MSTTGTPEDVWTAIKKLRVAMLTTDEDGHLVSRPMASIGQPEDGKIYFIAHTHTNIVRQGESVRVNLAYADSDKNTYLSIYGIARMTQDRAKLEELWSVWSEAWLPQGPDSPDVALIAVEPIDAKLWDANSKLIYAAKMLAAAAAQKPPSAGTVKEVRMARR